MPLNKWEIIEKVIYVLRNQEEDIYRIKQMKKKKKVRKKEAKCDAKKINRNR